MTVAAEHTASELVWRRTGHVVHLLVGAAPVCRYGRADARELRPDEIGMQGRPYGRVCERCELAHARLTAGMRPLERWLPDRRELWRRALEQRGSLGRDIDAPRGREPVFTPRKVGSGG